MKWAKHLLPLFWSCLTVAVVGGVVWVGLRQLQQPTTIINEPPATQPAPLPMVRAGHDYYVLVKLIEFNPRKPNGSYWDRGTNTAPDAKVIISWRGQEIFRLPQREDQFINTWDLFRVNIVDIVRNGGTVDIASSINAPIVRVEHGDSITLDVRDADVMYDDEAMKLNLKLDELHEGVNDIPPPVGCGIRRVAVQMVDRELSVSELVALAEKR